ncbi:hypothetical protein NEOLEDRAFT_1132755 [Neolentinus lepideus HHB14362 ss-1]|uniref:Uncharacterized protein n=1 Tax=Neolentinus lepideus HHB14362 ss-1 TaxID=1314782 RepID=A0A165T5P6_9AGAM|nr:hypothetical protein NEOLEDRAFT_1132755 [Neolentinus lepideus HHB14362 ss-1]
MVRVAMSISTGSKMIPMRFEEVQAIQSKVTHKRIKSQSINGLIKIWHDIKSVLDTESEEGGAQPELHARRVR